MNDQLIKKVITSNDVECPEFTFENPLLDKDVAQALSTSFVKILNISQENPQANNLRAPVLENIRKMCQTQPESHISVVDNATTLLSELYINKARNSNQDIITETQKFIDAFLMRNLLEMDIHSRYMPPLNPEIVQAFKNLKQCDVDQNIILKDIIHWNTTDDKSFSVLKSIWADNSAMSDDIAIKLKPELEELLLEICHKILDGSVANIEDIFISNTYLQNVINKSSNASSCFQICCSILHYIFVKTNFNIQIQRFIQKFVEHVKNSCPQVTYTVLYPTHLMNIVILLDIKLELFNDEMRNVYVKATMEYLERLHSESENDLIMLLSHFPQWHDIYFKNK